MWLKKGVLFLLVVVLVGAVGHAQIFLGTVDGFVTYAVNGSIAAGANVTVVVDGKSGAGANGSAFSDSGGYFTVANLNLNSGDAITVSGNRSNRFDSKSGTGDSFQTAQVNLSLVAVPFPPTLVDIADNHNNSFFLFNWTNGTDPDGLTTYNRFTLDSTTFNNTDPPQNRTFLSYAVHTWSVVTCNSFGCSSADTDSFNVFNNLPPVPILEDEPDTIQTNVTLNWTSGGADPDGDDTFFQFRLDSQALITNVTAPYNVTGLSFGLHTWRVRECDGISCTAYSTDTFSVTNNPPTSPSVTPIPNNFDNFTNVTWASGTDPDNQTTVDDFLFNFSTFTSNVTSPYQLNLTGLIDLLTVQVRTCDVGGACSSYDTEEFIHYVCPPPPETL